MRGVRSWRHLREEEITTANTLGESHFSVEDINTGDVINFSFNWGCSSQKIMYGQLLFLKGNVARGYADENNRIVPSSISAAKTELLYIRRICEYWQTFHPDRALRSLSLAEIFSMVRVLMRSAKSKDQIMSRSVLGTICNLLDRSNTLYNKGLIFDGAQFVCNKRFKLEVMAPLLQEIGLEYEEWWEGGSYGSIPLTCASIILNEAISIIESEETKLAQAFFESWRKYPCAPVLWFDTGKVMID